MKTYTTTALKAALPLAMLLLSSTAIQAKDLNQTFTGLKSIKITVSSGNVILKKSKNKTVTVNLDEDFNIDYNPSLEKNGSRLVIDDRDTRDNHRRYRGNAEWTISIPDGMKFDFRTGSGGIEITNLELDLNMKSGSGSADIEDSKGEFDISTGSGSADINNSSGTFEFSTGSGGADISDSSGSFEVSTGSGSLHSDGITVTEGSSFSTGSGSVSGRNLTLNAELEFSTGSGDVDLKLAKSAGHDISLSSGSGDATLDLNGAKLEGTLVMKAGKRRGRIKAPFDFDTTEESQERRRSSGSITKTKVFSKKDVRVRVSTGSGTARVSN